MMSALQFPYVVTVKRYTDAICVTTTSQYFELGQDNVEFFTPNKKYANPTTSQKIHES